MEPFHPVMGTSYPRELTQSVEGGGEFGDGPRRLCFLYVRLQFALSKSDP